MRSFYYAASRSHFHRLYKGFDAAAAKVLVRLTWQVPIAVINVRKRDRHLQGFRLAHPQTSRPEPPSTLGGTTPSGTT
jgi:hypothetical protein